MDAIAVGSVAVSARATSVTEANKATSILKSTTIELVEASAALRRRALDSPEISGLA
jgi:hypothetical protein